MIHHLEIRLFLFACIKIRAGKFTELVVNRIQIVQDCGLFGIQRVAEGRVLSLRTSFCILDGITEARNQHGNFVVSIERQMSRSDDLELLMKWREILGRHGNAAPIFQSA
jgi:hypothetical protein